MVFSENPPPVSTRHKITAKPLAEWLDKDCKEGDKLLITHGREGKVVVKCLVNITTGQTFLFGDNVGEVPLD